MHTSLVCLIIISLHGLDSTIFDQLIATQQGLLSEGSYYGFMAAVHSIYTDLCVTDLV